MRPLFTMVAAALVLSAASPLVAQDKKPKKEEAAPAKDADPPTGIIQAAEESAEEQEKKKEEEVEEEETQLLDDLAEPSTVTEAALEPEAPDEVRKLPRRLGPARLNIGDDGYLAFGFATQFEFEYLQLFTGAGVTADSTETLQFRRVRPIVSSSFLDGRITSRFQINLSPQAFELIDLWFGFTRKKIATVRLGQFKVPFTRYRAQAFSSLSFADWSPVTRMFGAERQLGAEVLSRAGKGPVEYAAGIFTGVNARGAHAVGLEEVYGEVPNNPSSVGDGEIVTEFHPEIIGRVAKNFGKLATSTNSDRTGGKIRQSLGANFAWDARPNTTIDMPVRGSVEWLAKLYHVHINLISYIGTFKRFTDGSIGFGPISILAETGYRFTDLWELAVRYSLTYLTAPLRRDAFAYAQFQIANAIDPIAAAEQYAEVGRQQWSEELALAGSAHIIGNSLRVLAEAAWEGLKVDQGLRNGFRFTLQIQFLY